MSDERRCANAANKHTARTIARNVARTSHIPPTSLSIYWNSALSVLACFAWRMRNTSIAGGLFEAAVSGPEEAPAPEEAPEEAPAPALRLFAPEIPPTPAASLRAATAAAPPSGERSAVMSASITASTTCGGASTAAPAAGRRETNAPSSAGSVRARFAAAAAAEPGAGGGGMSLGMFPGRGAFGS